MSPLIKRGFIRQDIAQFIADMAFDMALNTRAFECAIALEEFADRLTVDQRIAVELALIAGPDRAPLGMIALAAMVLGARQ